MSEYLALLFTLELRFCCMAISLPVMFHGWFDLAVAVAAKRDVAPRHPVLR